MHKMFKNGIYKHISIKPVTRYNKKQVTLMYD